MWRWSVREALFYVCIYIYAMVALNIYIYIVFNGTVSGVGGADKWGSRWRTERGGPGNTVIGRWGNCPVMGADDSFQLVICI